MQHTFAVDSLNRNRCIEEQALVHIPFCIEDSWTEACLEFGGNSARTFVNLYMPFVVDVTKNIVAGDRMSTMGENVSADIVLIDEDGFLFVQSLINHNQPILYVSSGVVGSEGAFLLR